MRPPPGFARALCRISGVIFGLMALAWVPGLVFSAYSFEGKEFLLGLVPVTIFSFLS